MSDCCGKEVGRVFHAAIRLVQALQLAKKHSRFNKKRSKIGAQSDIRMFNSELEALAELQALLSVMHYGSLDSVDRESFDIGPMLHAPSRHEELQHIRRTVQSTDTLDSTFTLPPDSAFAHMTHKEDMMQIGDNASTSQRAEVVNPMPAVFAILPFTAQDWAPADIRVKVGILISILREQRSELQSREEMLNDDCFALLRLCSKIPVHSCSEELAEPPAHCRRLHIHHLLLRCMEGPPSAGGGTVMLYPGTSTAVVNLSIDLLEHSQTHKVVTTAMMCAVEEQSLGLLLMYTALNLSSTSDLRAYIPWLLPKLKHMTSYIKEGTPHAQLHLTLLSVLIATKKELLSMKHSHLWVQEMSRHMSLYRNREALLVDLCLLYKGMTVLLSRTILACQAKGLLNTLLATLQFWQPRVQEMALLCILRMVTKCPLELSTQLTKVSLEALRLAAYFVPLLSDSSAENCPSTRLIMSSPEEISSLLNTVCHVAVTSQTLCAGQFDSLLDTLAKADAETAAYVKTKMEIIAQSDSASTSDVAT